MANREVKLFLEYLEPEALFNQIVGSTSSGKAGGEQGSDMKMRGYQTLADRVGIGLKRRMNATTKV